MKKQLLMVLITFTVMSTVKADLFKILTDKATEYAQTYSQPRDSQRESSQSDTGSVILDTIANTIKSKVNDYLSGTLNEKGEKEENSPTSLLGTVQDTVSLSLLKKLQQQLETPDFRNQKISELDSIALINNLHSESLGLPTKRNLATDRLYEILKTDYKNLAQPYINAKILLIIFYHNAKIEAGADDTSAAMLKKIESLIILK